MILNTGGISIVVIAIFSAIFPLIMKLVVFFESDSA
jgi:hypothetical protein